MNTERKALGMYTYIDIEHTSIVLHNLEERFTFLLSNYKGEETLEGDIQNFLQTDTSKVIITPSVAHDVLTWKIELSFDDKVFYTDISDSNTYIAEVENLMWLMYEYSQYKGGKICSNL